MEEDIDYEAIAAEQRLNSIISYYYDLKLEADNSKEVAEEYKQEIKEIMQKNNIDTFKTEDNFIAKLTTQHKESFKERELIFKLNDLGYTDVIDLVPTINYDKLEDLIYNGKIDAAMLAEYKIVKEIPVLKVTYKKGE